MLVNEKNKNFYESAFIGDGEYKLPILAWKPDIDERNIEESCEGPDGSWVPATPLGYRDYSISRMEGLKNIIDNAPAILMTMDELHNIKKSDNRLNKYDHLRIEENDFIVAGDDETRFFLVSDDNHLFFVEYLEEEYDIAITVKGKEYTFKPKILPGQKCYYLHYRTSESDFWDEAYIKEDQVHHYMLELDIDGTPTFCYCMLSNIVMKEKDVYKTEVEVRKMYEGTEIKN